MAKIVLFKDINYGGGALVLTGADSDLGPQGWNDKVSSLIVIDGTWNLYKDSNYGGTKWSVSANGGPSSDGTYKNPRAWEGDRNGSSLHGHRRSVLCVVSCGLPEVVDQKR